MRVPTQDHSLGLFCCWGHPLFFSPFTVVRPIQIFVIFKKNKRNDVVTHGLGPGKPGPRAAKLITPPCVENNYRIEVKITFILIAYLVLLCEFFWEFSIFHFCRPLVDIYWHPLLIRCSLKSVRAPWSWTSFFLVVTEWIEFPCAKSLVKTWFTRVQAWLNQPDFSGCQTRLTRLYITDAQKSWLLRVSLVSLVSLVILRTKKTKL